jgi:2-keto-4-pentenoate hydratase/2-oxohepta-3-ene-1,7-dioic acid hydratase in catechol pathway
MNSIHYQNKDYQPTKVVCVGRNFSGHIKELNNPKPDQPVIFLKPNSAISSELKINSVEPVHYESEISFLILGDRLEGVGFGLDLTKRTIQSELKAKGLPWERAKAFDGSAVFSDFVAAPIPIKKLRLELEINGKLMQRGEVSEMLYSPSFLLADIKSFLSLEHGDVLMTGTPSGVGVLNHGDQLTGKIYNGLDLLIQQKWIVS